MPGLKGIGPKDLNALMFFNQLLDCFPVSIRQHEIPETNSRS